MSPQGVCINKANLVPSVMRRQHTHPVLHSRNQPHRFQEPGCNAIPSDKHDLLTEG